MHKNRISVHTIFALLEKDRRLEVLNYFAIIITHKTLIISSAFILLWVKSKPSRKIEPVNKAFLF